MALFLCLCMFLFKSDYFDKKLLYAYNFTLTQIKNKLNKINKHDSWKFWSNINKSKLFSK